MKSISKYLPISLLRSLNDFNSKLIAYREEIEIISNEEKITFNKVSTSQVTIKYSVKDTNSYFEMIFMPNLDYLNYNYYPNEIISSKTKSTQKQAFDENVLKELNINLEKWKNNIVELLNLKDPLDFFKDTFIESYSAEIIEFVGNNNEKEYYPLTIEKQIKVIELINEQKDFVETQMVELIDKDSDKYKELKDSLVDLEYIKENLSRLTVKELKEKWSSTFAVLIKWCGNKLAAFTRIDAQNDGNISRSIGNLIGGIFNLPRIE
jgi:hypothetical protein